MRYSTNPSRDRWRVVLWTLVIAVALYLVRAAVPFGIDTDPEVMDKVGLEAGDRAAIVAYLQERDAILKPGDRKKIYWDTFWQPWLRQHIRSTVSIRPHRAVISVVGTKADESAFFATEYRARKNGDGWEFWERGQPSRCIRCQSVIGNRQTRW